MLSESADERLDVRRNVEGGNSSRTYQGAFTSEFETLALAEGMRATSIEQGCQVLIRFEEFIQRRSTEILEEVGWQEYAAFKAHLAESALARSTIRCYLSYVTTFYRLRAQAYQDSDLLEVYHKVKAVGSIRRARSVPWSPLNRATVSRLLDAAHGEDRIFLLTLLYTGGRAQFYGLRVEDVEFARLEIRAVVKGGKLAVIPLHPALAAVLRDHLNTRRYDSPFLFRFGKDVESRKGQRANRQNAWRICKRVQRKSGVKESVHPHRFRKTLATWGKRMGLDPQFLQAILAHESVNVTLDTYARVELEDVKRAFAELDLLAPRPRGGIGSSEENTPLGKLPELAAADKGRSLQMVVDGLQGLLVDVPRRVDNPH